MPRLTTNEIRKRLAVFARTWQHAEREQAQAQTFWLRFYECFGIRAESATVYESQVKKLDGALGFIDSFIPGKLIVEHKSRGKSLDKARDQADDYFLALPEAERPRYLITSDFARLRLYDLQAQSQHECTLAELPKRADWFLFLVEDDSPAILEESPINRRAAETVARLHETLLRARFVGHDLEIFLTRLLFCLFADDTGIFGSNTMFRRLVEDTRADGRDTGARLAELFEALNTPLEQRQSGQDEAIASFPYINGTLFAERTRIPAFDSTMRALLVQCAELDWSGISPAIFGAMFQGVLEEHEPNESRRASRRELGAHYTSERNILRVIEPLFLHELRTEFVAARASKARLQALWEKLPTLRFLDPACGCGNFLVIAYRELRRLEHDLIEAIWGRQRGLLDIKTQSRVRVHQFHGIELDHAAVHIARVALWITDHQMNEEARTRFGESRPSIPLVDTPTIVQANALRIDWASVLAPKQCAYVMGNPPFVGKQYQSPEQKADLELVCGTLRNAGLLDYVSGWYLKALTYLQANPRLQCAFVSTNSIAQGEQVAVLWPPLLEAGVRIKFAHRTFKWSNEGRGVAAVHCVIIGFGLQAPTSCTLYDYGADLQGEGRLMQVKRINPYLVDASDVVLSNRRTPLAAVPDIVFGSMPNDGGQLLLTDAEKRSLLRSEPAASKWIRPFLGADEFINKTPRWCLWLQGISPSELRALPEVYRRVQAVKALRLASPRPSTQALAATPYLFGEIRQPSRGNYLLVPSVSSERRDFIPVGFLSARTIASNLTLIIPNAKRYHFAMLSSSMHNAWMRAVCGRLKSDYRYSNGIVYNNYPWPLKVSDKQQAAIEAAAQAILDARALYPDASLADLYDPTAMPAELVKAHQLNDKAIDAAYGYRGDTSDAARVAFLFGEYEKYMAGLLPPSSTSTATRRRATRSAA